MDKVKYVQVDSMMRKLLGENWKFELNEDFLIPLAAIKRAVELSPQLIVGNSAENENPHF